MIDKAADYLLGLPAVTSGLHQSSRPIPLARYVGPGERLTLVRHRHYLRIVHHAARLPGGWRDLTAIVAASLPWPMLDKYNMPAIDELRLVLNLARAIPCLDKIQIIDRP